MAKTLLTEEDVRVAADAGKSLSVGPDTIITAAAVDLAAELNVKVGTPAATAKPAVALGADHGGLEMKNQLVDWLQGADYTVTDVGTHSHGF